VNRDDAEAFRWFQKSAPQGHTGARIKLGYMYAQGLATPKDPEAAYAWIASAQLAGDDRGRELLAKLETLLTPQHIAEARQRAQHLVPEAARQLSARAFAQ
jgi:TPR repeat protein